MQRRNLYCFLATLAALALYWSPLHALLAFALHNDIYFYSGVIPALSAVLIFLEKDRIFSNVRYDSGVGLALVVLALAIRGFSKVSLRSPDPAVALALGIFSFIVLWAGIFIFCYGVPTLRAAGFQLALLLLMIPLPPALMDKAILILRECSTQAAAMLFRLAGVPFFRKGFMFSLPHLDIEVAEQCSGIRSGLSFFITSLLVGHLFLRTSWGKLTVVLAAFPITVFKNGLRIVTIYALSIHPSTGSLVAWVHRYGGIPFSFLGLGMLAMLVASLRRWEEAGPRPGAMFAQQAVGGSAATTILDSRCQ